MGIGYSSNRGRWLGSGILLVVSLLMMGWADGIEAAQVGYWKMEEGSGTTTADWSGSGNTGTLNGGVTWSGSGHDGGGLNFGGTNGYVSLGTMDVTTSGITLAAWVRFDSITTDHRIISKCQTTGAMEQDHYWMLSNSSGGGNVSRFRLKTYSTTTTLIASSGTLTTDTWIHLGATYDGSAMRLYKDGLSVGSVSKSGPVATSASVPAWIGANPNNTNWTDGIIDEVHIFDNGLTQTQVQNLMGVPSAPGTPTVSDTTQTTISLGWTASTDDTGVSGYYVYRDGASVGTTGSAVYTDSGLTAATEYTYRVRAFDAVGSISEPSGDCLATTDSEADTQAPSVPGGLMVTGNTDQAVDLDWDDSTDNVLVIGYRVFRDGASIGTTAGSDYQDTGLIPDTEYTYTVSAFDAVPNESAQSDPLTTTTDPDGTAPTVPTGVSVDGVTDTSVTLSWTDSVDNVGVTGYRVFRDGVSTGTTATAGYVDSCLDPEVAYSYTVTAFDALANESSESSPALGTTAVGGEFTGDGIVDLSDLRIMADHWLETGACTLGNIDKTGAVDLDDLLLLSRAWTEP